MLLHFLRLDNKKNTLAFILKTNGNNYQVNLIKKNLIHRRRDILEFEVGPQGSIYKILNFEEKNFFKKK